MVDSAGEDSLKRKYDPLKGEIAPTLLHYTIPTILGMLATTLAIIVDGIFVGNAAGSEALAALNLVFPAIQIFLGLIYTMSTGVSASAGKLMGEGLREEVNQLFTQSLVILLIPGTLIFTGGIFLEDPLLRLLNVPPSLRVYARSYYITFMALMIFPALDIFICYFVRLTGHPRLFGTFLMTASAINILLDYLFIFLWDWGITGAAAATTLSHLPTLGLAIFTLRNSSLKLVCPRWKNSLLLPSFGNGLSEFFSETSGGFITFLFNTVIVLSFGASGVAGFSIMNYMILLSVMVYYGLAEAMQVLITQNFGACLKKRMNQLFRTAALWITGAGIFFSLGLLFFALPLSRLFISSVDENCRAIWEVVDVVRRFSWFVFPLSGLNILFGAYFTGIQKAGSSITVALSRTLILCSALVLFYRFWGAPWFFLSLFTAEFLTLGISGIFWTHYKPERLFS